MFFKLPSFHITSGIKNKDLIKGLEGQILVWPLYFLGFVFGKVNSEKLIPVMLNFILKV